MLAASLRPLRVSTGPFACPCTNPDAFQVLSPWRTNHSVCFVSRVLTSLNNAQRRLGLYWERGQKFMRIL